MSDVSAAAPDQPKSAKAWLTKIENADKDATKFLERARKIVKLYTEWNGDAADSDRKYAMLWANTEVVRPVVYAKAPKPVVTRRFNDQDPTGRQVSEVLERSLTSIFDRSNIDDCLRGVRDDYTLVGQGTAWIRYEPKFETVDPGIDGVEPYEQVTDETVCYDFVAWSDFIRPRARNWYETPWVGRRVYLDDKTGESRFGKDVWDQVKTTRENDRQKATSAAAGGDGAQPRDKSCIYEVWSKTDQMVLWLAKGYDKILEESPPLYDLHGFFPCPKPVFGTTSTDNLSPVADYMYYQDQAEEINELTSKIGSMEDMLKLVAFYPAGATGGISAAIETGLSPNSSDVAIPVPGFSEFLQGGGSGKFIDWLPIRDVAAALTEAVGLRKELINDVYQITGISDIMRGSTQASETLGAQQLKSQYGSIRIRDKQQEMARFARDLSRMTAEIVAEKFQPDTIWRMTGLKYPTAAEKAQIQAQMAPQPQPMPMGGQGASQTGLGVSPAMPPVQAGAPAQVQPPANGAPQAGSPQGVPQGLGMAPPAGPAPVPPQGAPAMGGQGAPPPIPPEIQRILDGPTQEDIIALLRDDQVRSYRVDVETDSTVEADQQAMQQSRTAALTAIGGFIQQSVPLLQAAPDLAPVVGESLLFLVRSFPAARSLEEVIEQGVEKIEQKAQIAVGQPDPKQAEALAAQQAQTQALQQQNQLKQAELQVRAQEVAGRQQVDQAKTQVAAAGIASKHQIEQQRLALTAQDQGADKQVQGADLALRARDQMHSHEMDRAGLAQSVEMQSHTIAQDGQAQAQEAQDSHADQGLQKAIADLATRQEQTESGVEQILAVMQALAKQMGLGGGDGQAQP